MSQEDTYDNDIQEENNKLSSSSSNILVVRNIDIGCDFQNPQPYHFESEQ